MNEGLGFFKIGKWIYRKSSKNRGADWYLNTKDKDGNEVTVNKLKFKDVKVRFNNIYMNKLVKVVSKRKNISKNKAYKLVDEWKKGKIPSKDLY